MPFEVICLLVVIALLVFTLVLIFLSRYRKCPSDRIMVMCDGRLTGFVEGDEATQENIMSLATQFESAQAAQA